MSNEMFYATNKRELEPMKIKLMACCCVNHSHRVHDVENQYIVDEKPEIGGHWVTQSGHTHKKIDILMYFNVFQYFIPGGCVVAYQGSYNYFFYDI